MRAYKHVLTGLVLLGSMVAAGCGPGASPPSQPGTPGPPAQKPKVIGAALLTQTHVFYQDLSTAMRDAAKAAGFDLEIQYCEFDGMKQNDQVETFIVKGIDALVIAPTDSAGVGPIIREARGRGIPVFTVDIAAEDGEVVSHIASDNVQGGRLAGEYLAKLLGGKGRVAIVDHPEVASVKDRVAGFEEALRAHPEMQIVAKVPGGGRRDRALQAAQDVLEAHPDLNGVFGINDDSALGTLAAAEAAGIADRIVIVGYDGTPEALEAIKKGTALKADTVQHPRDIGKRAIGVIAAHFRGEQVPKIVPVAVDIVDKASLEQEAAR